MFYSAKYLSNLRPHGASSLSSIYLIIVNMNVEGTESSAGEKDTSNQCELIFWSASCQLDCNLSNSAILKYYFNDSTRNWRSASRRLFLLVRFILITFNELRAAATKDIDWVPPCVESLYNKEVFKSGCCIIISRARYETTRAPILFGPNTL